VVTIHIKNHKIEVCGPSVVKRLVGSGLLIALFIFNSWGPISDKGLKKETEEITGVIKRFECEDIFGKVGHLYTLNSELGHQYQWRTGGMKVAWDDISELAGKTFSAHVRYGDRPIEITVGGKSILPMSEYSGRMKIFYPFVSVAITFLVFMWNFPSYATIREIDKPNE
jgi:hypothetical protein